ncbi:hypothetical protein U0070_014162, partial [Myodes glareolus]
AAADVGAPLPSSAFTTAGRRLCGAPPSPPPSSPRVPTPCRLYRTHPSADLWLSGIGEFFAGRAAAREQASSKGAAAATAVGKSGFRPEPH